VAELTAGARNPYRALMATDDTQMLREELEHYRSEKERVRQIVGQIGGQPSLRRTRWFNAAVLVLVVLLFLADLSRELFGLFAGIIPPFVLLEIAIFLLSLKIVWMIHLQMKLHHFQFWILNSLDYQVNDLSRRLRTLERSPARQDRATSRTRSRTAGSDPV
jgi:hypothetical protein